MAAAGAVATAAAAAATQAVAATVRLATRAAALISLERATMQAAVQWDFMADPTRGAVLDLPAMATPQAIAAAHIAAALAGAGWRGGYWHGGFWPRAWYGGGFAWFLPILPLAYATY